MCCHCHVFTSHFDSKRHKVSRTKLNVVIYFCFCVKLSLILVFTLNPQGLAIIMTLPAFVTVGFRGEHIHR